jgi:kelch-like protein 8
MSTKRRHVGVVSVRNKVYAVGGHDGTFHLSSGEVYDPLQNKWTPMASMSTMRRGLAIACLGGPLYAIGGLDDSICYNTVSLKA